METYTIAYHKTGAYYGAYYCHVQAESIFDANHQFRLYRDTESIESVKLGEMWKLYPHDLRAARYALKGRDARVFERVEASMH